MSEILVKYDEPIAVPNGTKYFAQAVGSEMEGGEWEGWIEFFPVNEVGSAVESSRETTQPNRANLELWAQGLTAVYLEGALARAISVAAGPHESVPTVAESGRFTKPARRSFTPSSPATVAARHPILDPFEVYAQGEQVLRGELKALSRDHLETIASAFSVIDSPESFGINTVPTADLIEAIVVKARDNPFHAAPDSGEPRAGP
jgi:hypothetical protein